MKLDTRTARYRLRIATSGNMKVLFGIFLLWGQYEFQESGTMYGFRWPHDMHGWIADYRTLILIVSAGWLICTGFRGDKRRNEKQ
jgi:hypothetical protein